MSALGWGDGLGGKMFAEHARGPEFRFPALHSSVTLAPNNGRCRLCVQGQPGLHSETPGKKVSSQRPLAVVFPFQPHLPALLLLYKWKKTDSSSLPHVASTVRHGNVDIYELPGKGSDSNSRIPAKFHPEYKLLIVFFPPKIFSKVTNGSCGRR